MTTSVDWPTRASSTCTRRCPNGSARSFSWSRRRSPTRGSPRCSRSAPAPLKHIAGTSWRSLTCIAPPKSPYMPSGAASSANPAERRRPTRVALLWSPVPAGGVRAFPWRALADAAQDQPARPELVQGGHHLRAAGEVVSRFERRRRRRLPGTHRQTRLHRVAGRDLPVAPAVFPLAAARRRVRHFRLLPDPPELRHPRRLQAVPGGGARAGTLRGGRDRAQSHLRRACLVSARAPRPAGLGRARLLRLERQRRPVQRCANHLRRQRALQLVLGRRGGGVLLAPVLPSPAGSQLRQS